MGGIAGVVMVLVGLFPVDELAPHIAVATAAFLSILATALWFATWSLRGDAPYPRWLGWFAAAIFVLVLVFLLVPAIVQPEYTFETGFSTETPRPDVLFYAALEWILILSAWIWIASLASYDRHRQGDPR